MRAGLLHVSPASLNRSRAVPCRAEQYGKAVSLFFGQRRRFACYLAEMIQPGSPVGWRPENLAQFALTASVPEQPLLTVGEVGMMARVRGGPGTRTPKLRSSAHKAALKQRGPCLSNSITTLISRNAMRAWYRSALAPRSMLRV
jgi:hypothetical protein